MENDLAYRVAAELYRRASIIGRDPFMLMVELLIKLHPEDVRKWIEDQPA